MNLNFLTLLCGIVALTSADLNDIPEETLAAKSGVTGGKSLPCSAVDTATVFGKKIDFFNCRHTWHEAQSVCKENGGRLWEPASKFEYEAVWTAIGYDDSTWPRKPAYLFSFFHWWIGFKNPNFAGSAAKFASSGATCTWKNLNENNYNEDCVDIYGRKMYWGDHSCFLKLPFICERTKTKIDPLPCAKGGKYCPLGQQCCHCPGTPGYQYCATTGLKCICLKEIKDVGFM